MSQVPEIVSSAFQSLLEEKRLSLANDNDILYGDCDGKSESCDDEVLGNADDGDDLFGRRMRIRMNTASDRHMARRKGVCWILMRMTLLSF